MTHDRWGEVTFSKNFSSVAPSVGVYGIASELPEVKLKPVFPVLLLLFLSTTYKRVVLVPIDVLDRIICIFARICIIPS